MQDYYLLFDDSCQLCQNSVKRLKQELTAPNLIYIPLSEGSGFQEKYHLTSASIRRELHVLGPENKIWRGVDAVIKIWEIDNSRPFLRKFLSLPGIYFIARQLYRLIARHRYLLN